MWLMMEVVILMLMVGAVVSDSVGGDSNVDGDVDGGDSVSGECVGLQCPYHDIFLHYMQGVVHPRPHTRA